MKNIVNQCFFLLLVTCLVACNSSPKEKTETLAVAASNTGGINGVDGNCVAPPEWFTGAVPTPQPQNFPQGDDVTNCDFHLISWQYFLWLTEEVNGKLRFENLYTSNAIHPETKDDTYQVLDIVEQALSKGILIDQHGRAVYSNIMINDIYRDWVLDNKLYDPEVFVDFDATADFPVGSMSLKANWKLVQPGEDVSNLYTTKADIQLLTMVDGEPRIPEDNPQIQKDVEVALIGLHIAVVVEGHPEFIWATFEFDGNAPNFKEDASGVVVQGMNDPVSDKNWLLYTANTTARKTNANNAEILEFVDESKQTLTPVTQVARQYAQGGGSSTNRGNIDHLNANAKDQLKKEGSIWENYFEVGAVWFNTEKGVLKPDWNPNVDSTMVTGSLTLSNATIETFTQKVRSQNSCFSCHNTFPVTNVPLSTKVLPGKNANTSHILLKNYQGGGEVKRSN
ncbi:hypothetical protein [Roseivirga seohaensis]|uniref:hypothetical protein n=1 Tax=Roseivirga seohaensis TaxID=1914963 RepID=UPI00069F701A|nr:hypothetical protein [Roseivirga seohaensis]